MFSNKSLWIIRKLEIQKRYGACVVPDGSHKLLEQVTV